MKTLNATLQTVFMVSAALMVALPIMVVCGAALNGGRSMLFPPQNPTLTRFGEFFLTEDVWKDALMHSVLIAFSSATVAVLMAWPIAWWLWRYNQRWSKTMATISSMPFALPPIVFGVGLGFMWGFADLLGTLFAGILSHALLLLALPVATVSIGLQSIDRSHIDAARTMGATDAVALKTVIFPLTMPYTISGFFFTLILSFNEFIVMFFVSASAYSTVTLQIFNSLRNGFTPTMAVGAITFISASILVFGLIARFGDLPRLMGADQTRS